MTLTTDIESVSGDTLEANQTWSFRTRDRAWADTPVLIEVDDAGDASNPQMAVDPSGRAVGVWQQFDGLDVSIWSSRFE